MRKFTKILTICLVTIALVTAFAIVSVAALAKPYTFTQTQSKAKLNFDDWEVKVLSTVTNADGVTKSTSEIREAYPGGNRYMYFSAGGGQGGAASWNSEITYSRSTYDVTEAPIMAVDFDIMTLNGRFGTTHNSANIVMRPYYYNGSGYKQFGASGTGAADRVAFGQIGLNNEAYLWQHVTIIYEWVVGGTINTYVHINGASEPSYTATKDVSAEYASYADYIEETFFGVPYLTGAVWGQKSEVGLDNYKQSYFPAGYNRADVPTYIYNSSYTMPEAYKYTVATVTTNAETPVTTYYDDISKATAALQDGYTLTLAEAPAEAIVINNAITLDTAGFEVTVESTAGYGITSTTDGVHTIEKLPSATVNWDVCPSPENCTCLGAHKLAVETEVVVGEIPEYVGEIPELEFDGLVLTLLGWSYENDGTVDELKAIEVADAETGVTLYPVFSQAEYDFRLDSKGVITYYTADQYVELFAAAERDDNTERTVTLLRDAEVYDMITFSRGWSSGYVKVTLDLRGNTLTRVNLTGNKYKYNGTEYVADGTLASTGANAFYCNKPNTTFTITSSEGKGNFVTYAVSGDIYYDENGVLEKYEATTVVGSKFIYFYNNAKRNIYLNNINIYAKNIFDGSGGSNTDCSVNVNNCSYYATTGTNSSEVTYTFYLESGTNFDLNATNSFFYYPTGLTGQYYFMRLADNSKNSNYTVTVDNCDIIGGVNMIFFNFYSATPKIKVPTVNVNNTRLYNATCNGYYPTYLGYGTLYSQRNVATSTVTPGYVSAPSTKSIPYTVPESTVVTIDAETKQPVLSNNTATFNATFAYEVKKCSETPESIKNASLSILYYTDFDLALYLPVTEGMTVSSVAGFEKAESTVKIDGEEYYVYKRSCTTVNASDTVNAVVSYTVNGGSYRQTFEISALIYAELCLNSSLGEVETTAIANMVRYIKEARLASSLTAGTEFDELIALGNLDELGAQEDYADASVDYSALSEYVDSITFMVDGTFTAYVITVNDAAIAAGAEVTASYVGGDALAVTKNVTTDATTGAEITQYLTTKTKIYDIACNAVEITVTVPDANGGEPTVLTGTYSVKAYINATNTTLAKAMYEFGVAAKAYREYLIENT